jgi:hypothetical protein
MYNDVFVGCNNATIYCEEASRPAGWSTNWNSSKCPVVWGYKHYIESNKIIYGISDDYTASVVLQPKNYTTIAYIPANV